MTKNNLNEDADKSELGKVEIKKDFKGREFKVGYLPNGDKVVSRSFSTRDGRPTLEYQKKENSKFCKIRYNE